STTILSWLLTRWVDSLCCQSFLRFFTCACSALSACFAFKRFLLLFSFFESCLSKYLIFASLFLKKWGFLIASIPVSVAGKLHEEMI
ncbi:MAG: hypothetical protein WAM28_01545, partial [Chlamydiales bacterium]